MKKNPQPRRARTTVTQQLKENIVRDYHDSHFTIYQLVHKYACCFKTCKEIVEKNPYGFWNAPPGLAKAREHRPVSDKRKDMAVPDRLKQLSEDAIEVIELTIQQMNKLLRSDTCDMSASQLAAFIASVAPYAIPKKDNSESKKEQVKPVSSRDQFDMFKKQVS